MAAYMITRPDIPSFIEGISCMMGSCQSVWSTNERILAQIS